MRALEANLNIHSTSILWQLTGVIDSLESRNCRQTHVAEYRLTPKLVGVRVDVDINLVVEIRTNTQAQLQVQLQ